MSQTIAERIRFEDDPIKGSRFIATAIPVADESQAKDALAEIRSEMPDAGHHCWAWRIASPAIDRASDDGEPSGSAGKPILAQLVGRELVDTAVVVSRFWGGTKLGVGGLVRAYGGAAGAALDQAEVLAWVTRVPATIRHAHGDLDSVVRAMAAAEATDVDVGYGAAVTRLVEVPADNVELLVSAIADATSGRATVE